MKGALDSLEELYGRFNGRKYVHPDPLEFLYLYEHDRDKEVVGLIASTLAYGRVHQILKSVSQVLEKMGPSPYEYIREGGCRRFKGDFEGFRHRFTTGDQMVSLMGSIHRVLKEHASLERCFGQYLKEDEATVLPALTGFIQELGGGSHGKGSMFLPLPQKGSACKRLNLFLRWMVRRDAVDPGVWRGVPACKLIVPLDTHMHRIALQWRFTRRRQADMRAALEVTRRFKKLVPADPVRYDFVLTRIGISRHEDLKNIFLHNGSLALTHFAPCPDEQEMADP